MLDHISLPVADYQRSRAFYDRCLGALGYKMVKEIKDAPDFLTCGYGGDGDRAELPFWITAPRLSGVAPTTPEGLHVAFGAASRAAVDAFHRDALAAGGTDNGPPGLRPQYHANYYAAFVLDPDGHRIEAVCHGAG